MPVIVPTLYQDIVRRADKAGNLIYASPKCKNEKAAFFKMVFYVIFLSDYV